MEHSWASGFGIFLGGLIRCGLMLLEVSMNYIKINGY